jgi:sugar phosphate isomerase/epimerase
MSSLSRRRFIAGTGVVGAAAVAGSLLPRAAWGSPLGLPVGIQLYMVSNPLKEDTPGTLKKLHELGFREVETAGLGMYSAKEFRGLLDDAGLTCPSVHLQVKEDDYESEFAVSNTLGAHYAVTSLLRIPESTGVDHFKKLAARMNEIGKRAKAAGVQYAYHNHNMEFEKLPDGSPGYDILLKETDAELVKFEIDCGWMVVAGANPVEYFKKYPGRFRMLHIKDFKPVSTASTDLGAGRPKGTELGTGFVQYEPIFAGAKGAGIEHVFAEQEAPYAVSQLESAKVAAAFLEKFS